MVFCIGLIASHAPMYGPVPEDMDCDHAPLRIAHDNNITTCFTWTHHKTKEASKWDHYTGNYKLRAACERQRENFERLTLTVVILASIVLLVEIVTNVLEMCKCTDPLRTWGIIAMPYAGLRPFFAAFACVVAILNTHYWLALGKAPAEGGHGGASYLSCGFAGGAVESSFAWPVWLSAVSGYGGLVLLFVYLSKNTSALSWIADASKGAVPKHMFLLAIALTILGSGVLMIQRPDHDQKCEAHGLTLHVERSDGSHLCLNWNYHMKQVSNKTKWAKIKADALNPFNPENYPDKDSGKCEKRRKNLSNVTVSMIAFAALTVLMTVVSAGARLDLISILDESSRDMRSMLLFGSLFVASILGVAVHFAWTHLAGPPTEVNGCGIGRDAVDRQFGPAYYALTVSSYVGLVVCILSAARRAEVIEYFGLQTSLL